MFLKKIQHRTIIFKCLLFENNLQFLPRLWVLPRNMSVVCFLALTIVPLCVHKNHIRKRVLLKYINFSSSRNVWPRIKPFWTRLFGKHAALSHTGFYLGKNVLTACYTTHSIYSTFTPKHPTWYIEKEHFDNSSSCRYPINIHGQLWTEKITALIKKFKHIDLVSFINHELRFTACQGAIGRHGTQYILFKEYWTTSSSSQFAISRSKLL